jgi:hypothetical protein
MNIHWDCILTVAIGLPIWITGGLVTYSLLIAADEAFTEWRITRKEKRAKP